MYVSMFVLNVLKTVKIKTEIFLCMEKSKVHDTLLVRIFPKFYGEFLK